MRAILMISTLFAGEGMAQEKSIVLGERIIKNNPWRNELIQRQYKVALAEAWREHLEQFPGSKIKVQQSFDEGPNEGFTLADQTGALGVMGYLYSTEAFEASRIAEERRIPYLSPVSPINSVKNPYSFSMASSMSQLVRAMKELQNRDEFRNPSIVLLPETFLPNFEYETTFRKAFDVIETFRGTTVKIWNSLQGKLADLTLDGDLNILFAGFAFEQMDLVKLIGSTPYTKKIKMIGHAQWNYCPKLLAAVRSADVSNFYVISDYFNVSDLPADSFPVSQESLKKHLHFREILESEPPVEGQSIEEPVVYVLKDMISMGLKAAETSKDRTDFNKVYSTQKFQGSAGTFQIKDKVSDRPIYLGKWGGKKFDPIGMNQGF